MIFNYFFACCKACFLLYIRNIMKKRVFHSFTTLALGLTLLAFSSCRLDDKGPHAEIYPQDGSTNVPVNTVIEVQYLSEFGLKESDMKESLFSINECTSNTFKYFTDAAKAKAPADPASTEKKSDKTETDSKDSNNDSVAEPTKGDKVNFYFRTLTDAGSQIIFNFLVVDPAEKSTPLKPNTTYCVEAKNIKNEKGELIKSKTVSFTTENEANFEFDSKIDPEFFGNEIAASILDDKGSLTKRDYVLVYFRNQSVRPQDLKKRITLCKETPDQTTITSQSCGDFNGKPVASDISLIENLKNDANKNIPSSYNLYAVTAHEIMKAGEKYKIILNMDMGSENDTNVGFSPFEFDVVDNLETLNWDHAYNTEIKDGSEQSIATPTKSLFYVGPGSYSIYAPNNVSADNSTAPQTQATF